MRALCGAMTMALCVACGVETTRQPAVHSSEQALRPTDTASDVMWRYAPGDAVESIAADGGSFRVHFTQAGSNRVPSVAFAEGVLATYEQVGALYHGPLAYRHPLGDAMIADNGGDDRFDVYLLDFALSADGAFRVDRCPSVDRCIGYVVQENDFAGYGYPSLDEATRILGSHEYFHAVQAAYDSASNIVISEGTAVWATERYDPASSDFEHFVGGYLSRTDRSLDSPPPGPVPSFAYGASIFFKFLTEKHGDDVIRRLWEHLEDGHGAASEPDDQANPTFVVQLDALLKSDYDSSFATDFAEFSRWNLFTGLAADSTQAWLDASRFPDVTMTTAGLPFSSQTLRVYYASAQYFTAAAGSRNLVTGRLLDSAVTATDDREALRLILAVKYAGRIVSVVTDGGLIDASGADLIAVVVNTRRGAVGTTLSQRPVLCLGTAEEVAACAGEVPDAGIDAGMAEVDAGLPDAGPMMTADAGAGPGVPTGCGCGMAPAPVVLLGLFIALTRKRNRP